MPRNAKFWASPQARIGYDPPRTLFLDDSLPILRAARDYGQAIWCRCCARTARSRCVRAPKFAAVLRLGELLRGALRGMSAGSAGTGPATAQERAVAGSNSRWRMDQAISARRACGRGSGARQIGHRDQLGRCCWLTGGGQPRERLVRHPDRRAGRHGLAAEGGWRPAQVQRRGCSTDRP